MTKVTIDVDKLVETLDRDSDMILTLLDIDLSDRSSANQADLTAEIEWHCPTEDRWWKITGRQINISDLYAIRWTCSDEAGVDDVEIVDRYTTAEEDSRDLTEWLDGIARDATNADAVRVAE